MLTNRSYNAIANTLHDLYLNPELIDSMAPEECKQVLQKVMEHYIEQEAVGERMFQLTIDETVADVLVGYPDGSTLIFSSKDEAIRHLEKINTAIKALEDAGETQGTNYIALVSLKSKVLESTGWALASYMKTLVKLIKGETE